MEVISSTQDFGSGWEAVTLAFSCPSELDLAATSLKKWKVKERRR